ncbi:MAG: FAD-dependent oxidoreductase [Atribacterota bacterium]
MDCDVLVIGNGIAGSVTALLLAEQGFRVVLLTKGETLEETNTAQAQGGIVFRGPGDSATSLYEDITNASSGSSSKHIARLVSRLGPVLVKKILFEYLSIPFDRDAEGNLDFFREGAHSLRRILHVKDYTGRVIQQVLNEKVKAHPLVELGSGFMSLELIISSYHAQDYSWRYKPRECWGAYVLDRKRREIIPILAPNTVLATGGLNAIYEYSSGGSWNTGDGLVMATRAGAYLTNMEYVQFHPTLFFSPKPSGAFLISEVVRGEGAELVDRQGRSFMHKYHPMGSLAPRDVVARAIFRELQRTQEKCVYLDLYKRLSPEKIRTAFPGIYEELLGRGLDITREPIPVVPGAHFLCGGILTDSWGRTNLGRLYAVGEVACTGLHGANRLASTSLLEALTFSYQIARRIVKTQDPFPRVSILPWEEKIGDPPPASVVEELQKMVKTNTWKHVGLIRHRQGLSHAKELLLQLTREVVTLRNTYGVSMETVELANMVKSALLVTESALRNPYSCGAHFRIDSLKS